MLNRLPWRRNQKPARPEGLPMLVITNTFQSALEVLPMIEREGGIPRVVPIAGLNMSLDLYPTPVAVLLLRELPTDAKLTACSFVRSHEQLRDLPVAAVCSLLERSSEIPADIVVRPPESLRDAVRGLRALVEAKRKSADA